MFITQQKPGSCRVRRNVPLAPVGGTALEREQARVFLEGDFLRIRVSAQGDSQQTFDEEIPYGLVVTLEVREGNGLRIDQQVRERLGEAVRAEV